MSDQQPFLGISFYGNKLYYAVSGEDQSQRSHIGCIEFNFSVAKAVAEMHPDYLPLVHKALGNIRAEHKAHHLRIHTDARGECWTILPKSVYDNSDEREAYLEILMQGVPRNKLEPVWYSISNRDYKLLAIRNKNNVLGLEKLAEHGHSTDFCSDFEIGTFWVNHAGKNKSFLLLSCHKQHLCVSSYLLGKLRAATCIKFDDVADLPYFWLQQKANLSWMDGLHDEILFFGEQTKEIHQCIKPYMDAKTSTVFMDSLKKMNLTAKEKSYSFDLKEAFPAIMLAS